MTRNRLPASPRPAEKSVGTRARISTVLLVLGLALAVFTFHPCNNGVAGTHDAATVSAAPAVPLLASDQISTPASWQVDAGAEDVRTNVGDPERDPRYYDEGVRR